MSVINANWNKWIFASVSKHFDTYRGTLPMFVEGQVRDTHDTKDFFELRMDGPNYTEYSKGYFRVYIEVNCLLQSAMDDIDFHRIHRNLGIVASIFTRPIVIKKYGDTPIIDDGSTLGCLSLISDDRGKEKVQTSQFGQITQKDKLIQAIVEAHYEIFLTV